MDKKLYNNAVDIQTKQIEELTKTVTLFEGMKTGNLGIKTQIIYIVALADFTITVRYFVKIIIISIICS